MTSGISSSDCAIFASQPLSNTTCDTWHLVGSVCHVALVVSKLMYRVEPVLSYGCRTGTSVFCGSSARAIARYILSAASCANSTSNSNCGNVLSLQRTHSDSHCLAMVIICGKSHC